MKTNKIFSVIAVLVMIVIFSSCRTSYVPATDATLKGVKVEEVDFYLKDKTTWTKVNSFVRKKVKDGAIIECSAAPDELVVLPYRAGKIGISSFVFDNGTDVPLYPMTTNQKYLDTKGNRVYMISDTLKFENAKYQRTSTKPALIYVNKKEMVSGAHISKGYKKMNVKEEVDKKEKDKKEDNGEVIVK